MDNTNVPCGCLRIENSVSRIIYSAWMFVHTQTHAMDVIDLLLTALILPDLVSCLRNKFCRTLSFSWSGSEIRVNLSPGSMDFWSPPGWEPGQRFLIRWKSVTSRILCRDHVVREPKRSTTRCKRKMAEFWVRCPAHSFLFLIHMQTHITR